jgi:hypothetical protein
MAPAISTHHAEWLSLVETSGPFLSVPVLSRALPQGLDAPDRTVTTRMREARTQLAEDQTLYRAWCEFVLHDVLEFEDAVVAGPEIPPGLEHRASEQGETVRPDLVVVDRSTGAPQAVLLVTIHPPTQQLERRLADAAWSASPIDRIAALCRAAQVPLGLTTNGRSWTLVWARPGESTGVCTWDAELWLEEPLTLRAFRTLLGAHRFFTVAADETLPELLEESAQNQQEVTDRLGAQVREAVELLIDALDRADRDRHGQLLGEIANEELYRAAVTVMMRLVFLFVAEERRLLPLDDPLYAQSYAASTLRGQLEERATRFGEDPLERSSAAWYRLLALSRAVFGGIEHEALRLPAYGGGLFDPDRYPFLEGRGEGSTWRQEPSHPLPVDDRTVMHLLTALQVLEEPGRAGQPRAAVRLSFRALDVEQIGHVYEGLLDHTAVRTFDAAVGLVGREQEEIAITELERAREQGEDALIEVLKERTKKSPSALGKALAAAPNPDRDARLLAVCDNDPALRDRLLPFLGVIRDDLRADPRVFLPGALYVTKTLERRSSGTYYTPRSLAEEVVLHALDPIAYSPGPAEEADASRWQLKPAGQLLDLKIADIAMGSGAFLVAACRYLAARLLEAWDALDDERRWTVFGQRFGATTLDAEVPSEPAEREVLAHRLIAERCLYGVDKNPMAVEMAKLSLWLITLAKDRPFSFLDHALRTGDSLLGVTSLAQVRALHMDPARGPALKTKLRTEAVPIGQAVDRALELRRELESFVVREIGDAKRKARLHAEASDALADARLLADLTVGAALALGKTEAMENALVAHEDDIAIVLDEKRIASEKEPARERLRDRAQIWMNQGRVDVSVDRCAFHWPLELPEVFVQHGFDAVVSNPPFQGGKRISGAAGPEYREHLVVSIAGGRRGSADLVAYFVLRGAVLLSNAGMVGFLATNTIGQGGTREVALDYLLDSGYALGRAVRSAAWPGGANLEVSHVWLRRGGWDQLAVLDGKPVTAITSALEAASRVAGTARRLAANAGHAFQGSNVVGLGFVLTAEGARGLIGSDPRNIDVVRPYLSGEDLVSRPDCAPSRWIIDFGERSELEASSYTEPWRIVEARVKPERMEKDPKRYAKMVTEWWKFCRSRPALYRAIAGLDRVVVLPRVSKVLLPLIVPNGVVFHEKVVVVDTDDDAIYGLLTSGLHWWWAIAGGTTLETRPVYTPESKYETFPFPEQISATRAAGAALNGYRNGLMLDRQEGLTATYNRVHAPEEASTDINHLRELHVEVDYAALNAYGWSDLDLGHGFHDTSQGIRYTFEPIVRQEILDRLLELNLDRWASEEAAGSRTERNASTRRHALGASANQASMFDDG